MNRLVARRFVAALLLIVVAIGALWLGRFLSHRGLEWAAKFSEVASFVLAVAGVVAAPFGKIAQWLRGPKPPTLEQIASDASRLRAALTAASDAEGSEVYENQPMQVRFSPWAESVDRQALPDAVGPDVSTAGQPPDGDFGHVVEAFSREPRFRRVVLGEAGAGKSVLVAELQRKLLSAAGPDDPVPVIVSAGAWRPDRQSLLDWLADRLATDHAWLPVTHARALVAGSKVLPILDGLDEMPRVLQANAIARINEHRVYRPLVLTSREEQYADAIRQNREGIKNALAVAIRPLLVADIWAYLDPTGRGPWAGVLAGIDVNGPLAEVLANPLMLWLARVVYHDANPGRLTSFSTRTSLENHLLDQFVPAVYDADRDWAGLRKFRCTGKQAERWLGALAYSRRPRLPRIDQYLRAGDRGSVALAWWRFGDVAGRWRALGIAIRALVLSGVSAALLVWVLARHGNWRHGAYSGPVNFGDLLLSGRLGQLIRPTAQKLFQPFPKDAGRQVQAVVDSVFQGVDYVLSRPLLFALVVVVSTFLYLGISYRWLPLRPRRLQIRAIPALARALTSCLLRFATAVVAVLVLLHLPRRQISVDAFFDARSTWVALFAISLVGLTTIPSSFIRQSDTSGNLSPQESLRLDRQADVVVAVVRRSAIAVTLWLFCGPQIAAAYGIFAVTATLVMLTLGGQGVYASRSYVGARIWFSARGRLPWRTMTFLADASRRGVLRQTGATYQFRHARLQEQARNWRLARRPPLKERWNTWKGQFRKAADVNSPGWAALDELCEEAATLRRIARTSPGNPPPRLGYELDSLAYRLENEPEGALAARILLDAHRALAEADPVASKPGLARAMNFLASIFPRVEALRWYEDAVGEYRELAEDDPATFMPGLAQAVRDLADQLARLGQPEEALRTVSDLVDTCRGLGQTDPATFLPVLAKSLSDLADQAWKPRPEDSLAHRREAISIYRKLADEDSARYGSRLASSLEALAACFRELEKREEELAAVTDAIDTHRKRAEHIAAVRHQIEQRPTTAAKAAYIRDLAKSQPTEFLPALDYAVRDLAVEIDMSGSPRAALTLVVEADRIRQRHRSRRYGEPVVIPRGDAREERAADRMAALALRLWKLGEHEEASSAAQISRELAPAGRIGANAPDLLHSELARLIIRVRTAADKGRQREDTRFWRRIARQNHDHRRPPVAIDVTSVNVLDVAQQLCALKVEWLSDRLDTLAFRRQVAGRSADALTATRRAVNIQRWAVSIHRRVHAESDLARSLDVLALRLRADGQAEAAADAAAEANRARELCRPTSRRHG